MDQASFGKVWHRSDGDDATYSRVSGRRDGAVVAAFGLDGLEKTQAFKSQTGINRSCRSADRVAKWRHLLHENGPGTNPYNSRARLSSQVEYKSSPKIKAMIFDSTERLAQRPRMNSGTHSA